LEDTPQRILSNVFASEDVGGFLLMQFFPIAFFSSVLALPPSTLIGVRFLLLMATLLGGPCVCFWMRCLFPASSSFSHRAPAATRILVSPVSPLRDPSLLRVRRSSPQLQPSKTTDPPRAAATFRTLPPSDSKTLNYFILSFKTV